MDGVPRRTIGLGAGPILFIGVGNVNLEMWVFRNGLQPCAVFEVE